MFRLSGLYLDRQILTLKLQYIMSGKFTTTLSENIRCSPLSYLFGPIFKSRTAWLCQWLRLYNVRVKTNVTDNIRRNICPSVTLSTKNSMWSILRLNPGLSGEKSATYHLKYLTHSTAFLQSSYKCTVMICTPHTILFGWRNREWDGRGM